MEKYLPGKLIFIRASFFFVTRPSNELKQILKLYTVIYISHNKGNNPIFNMQRARSFILKCNFFPLIIV